MGEGKTRRQGMRTRVWASRGQPLPKHSISFPGGAGGGRPKKDAAVGKWKGSREAGRLAEAVLILSRCQRFLRRCGVGRHGLAAAPSQAPCRGGTHSMDPPKTASCGSVRPCNPHPCPDTTLLQAGGVSLCSPGWVQGAGWVWGWGAAGLELGRSTQWLPKPQAGRGRWVPQGKERQCLCWGGTIRAAP